ncbi:P-loop NTPase family protein [Pseudodesulfovibrio piezophilus]|uniref:ATPase involved in DNA repair-like protein n=1 Tax=Pseudodesulfovibrio piezophilus (strain DSM 21447 / JCM 15486 / C1TLV30) TaxID=1322246 RepID=M1WMG6_PSEP2|nr:ATPase involved in DNA repair-like protein [Pseudodesulfovibrio piezophilus]CCH49570.1 ATPase involved in DNA repair-like protein [Pseudodesulfovibrio piezophilus C1TLV30]
METPFPGTDLRALERRHDRLSAKAEALHAEHGRVRKQLGAIQNFLVLAPAAKDRLEELSKTLFGKILDEVELNLTHAIREILGQDRVVFTERDVKNNRLQIQFQIRNRGNEDEVEDIMSGQGGSVCNILSVGLRLIALSQLPEEKHRPFLVLDEQDCWLKPALVPKFMQLIHEIAERLSLQLLVISHHPLDLFSGAADRIFELRPDKDSGARVVQVK